MSRKTVRSTSAQMRLLMDFMSNHVEFANNEIGPSYNKKNIALWSRLKALLARCGPDKDISQWKTTWKDFKRRAIQKALSGKVDSIEMAKCIEIIKARKRADSDDADDLEQTNVEDNSNQFEDSKNNDDDNIMCERFQKPPKVEKKFRTKRIRSSQAQLNYLREYMKSHQDFASNRDKSFMGQKRYEAEWVKLKGLLDQHGLEKSLHKWKTTWRDIKRQKNKERAKSDDNNAENDSSSPESSQEDVESEKDGMEELNGEGEKEEEKEEEKEGDNEVVTEYPFDYLEFPSTETESRLRRELHEARMENEKRIARNLDLKYKVLQAKLQLYRNKNT